MCFWHKPVQKKMKKSLAFVSLKIKKSKFPKLAHQKQKEKNTIIQANQNNNCTNETTVR